jgi:hypothetical protein
MSYSLDDKIRRQSASDGGWQPPNRIGAQRKGGDLKSAGSRGNIGRQYRIDPGLHLENVGQEF